MTFLAQAIQRLLAMLSLRSWQQEVIRKRFYNAKYVDIHETLSYYLEREKANKESNNSSSEMQNKAEEAKSSVALVSDIGFKALDNYLKEDATRAADLAAKVRANVVFELIDSKDKPIKYWYMNLKTTTPQIREITFKDIEEIKPHAVLTCQDKTIIGLFKGSISPEFAYMRGQLKLQGQMGAALKIKGLLELSKTLKIDA